MANNVAQATLRIIAEVKDLISGPMLRAAGVTEQAQAAALGMLDALGQLNQAQVAAGASADKFAKSEEALGAKLPKILATLDGMAEATRVFGAEIAAVQTGTVNSVNGLTAAFDRAKVSQADLFAGTKIGAGLQDFVRQSEEAAAAIRATQLGTIASTEQLAEAFNAPIAKAAELRAALDAKFPTPLVELEGILAEVGISATKASEALRRVRPPQITPEQVERASVALRQLGLTAEETQAALQELGLVRIDPTPIERFQAALTALGVTGATVAEEIALIKPPRLDVAKLNEARAALLGLGLGAKEADAAMLRLGLRPKTAVEGLLQTIGAQGKTFGQILTSAFTSPIKALGQATQTAFGSTAAVLIGGFIVFNKLREGTTNALAFSKAMAQVASIVDKTASELDGLRDEVLGLSREFGLNELDVAKGLYLTLSSGIEQTTDALKLLRSANQLAVAGFADSSQVIDLLTSTINAYGLKVEDATHLNDVFFTSVRLGKAELPEFAASIGTVIPIAAQLGVGIEQVSGAIATLTLGGRKADVAATGLRQVLINLLNPTADAQAILASLEERLGLFGGKTIPDFLKSGGTLFDVFTKLRTAVGGNTAALREILPDARAFSVVAALTGEQYGQLRHVLDEVTLSAGATQRALEKTLEAPFKRVEILSTAIRQGFESLGNTFISALIPASAQLKDVHAQADALRKTIESLGPLIGETLGVLRLVGLAVSDIGIVATDVSVTFLEWGDRVYPVYFLLKRLGIISKESIDGATGALDRLNQAQTAASIALSTGSRAGFDALKIDIESAANEIPELDGRIKSLRDEIKSLGTSADDITFNEGSFNIPDSARIQALSSSLDELNKRRAYLVGFVGDIGSVRRAMELTKNQGTELVSVFDLLRTGAVTQIKPVNTEAIAAVSKAVKALTVDIGTLQFLAAKGDTEFELAFPEIDTAKAREQLKLLQDTLVRVPDGLIVLPGAAKVGLGELGEEADIAGAKLKALQLSIARADIGRDIALMAAQASEALAGIGGGFAVRIAALKVQAVELRSAFDKALEGIDAKKVGGEFGIAGTVEATVKEQTYRSAIEALFNAQRTANEIELQSIERAKAQRDALVPLIRSLSEFGVAFQVAFAAQRIVNDEASKSIAGLSQAYAQLNLTVTEKAHLDLLALANSERAIRIRLSEGGLTKTQIDDANRLLDVNARARSEIEATSGVLIGAKLQDLLRAAIPQLESGREQLIAQLSDINKELDSFAGRLPTALRIGFEAANRALSGIAINLFDEKAAAEQTKRIQSFQRETVQAQAFVYGEFADRFVGIQNQTAQAIEALPDKVKAVFGAGGIVAGVATLDLRKKLEKEIEQIQLNKLTVQLLIEPKVQLEEGLLFDQLVRQVTPLTDKLDRLFGDKKSGSITPAQYAAGLREVRAEMRALRSEVFDTAAAFNTGFSAGIQDFIDESTNAFRNGQDLARTFGDGLTTMFQGIIDGSLNAGDAIRQFGVTILQEMNKIISQRLAARLLDSLFGSLLDGGLAALFGGGFGGGPPAVGNTSGFGNSIFAEGGIMPGKMGPPQSIAHSLGVPFKAYEHGGIARGPQLALFGEAKTGEGEAFVPLKNGSIPVDFKRPIYEPQETRRNSRGTVEMHMHFDQSFSSLEPVTAAKLVKQAVISAVGEIKAGFAGSDRDLYEIARGAR